MISAVDTNVLLDLLVPEARHGEQAERALTQAGLLGAVLVSEPVYAELSARFPDRAELDLFLLRIGAQLSPSGPEALFLAGQTWLRYIRQETRCAGVLSLRSTTGSSLPPVR